MWTFVQLGPSPSPRPKSQVLHFRTIKVSFYFRKNPKKIPVSSILFFYFYQEFTYMDKSLAKENIVNKLDDCIKYKYVLVVYKYVNVKAPDLFPRGLPKFNRDCPLFIIHFVLWFIFWMSNVKIFNTFLPSIYNM